jgi:hypothetical protein
MKNVTLDVASVPDVTRRALDAFKGKKQGARISFATPGVAVEGADRQTLGVAQGHGRARPAEHSRGGAARRTRREGVHGDIQALLNAGVLDRTEKGRVVFPFEAVRVEFTLRAA